VKNARALAILGVLAAAGLAVLAALLAWAPVPDIARFEQRSTVVRDSESGILRAFPAPGGQWRIETEPSQVDPLYLGLLIAVEDKRFHIHPGVDPLAILRAIRQAADEGRIVSGASTLAMQTAKLLSPRARNWRAKLGEAAGALKLQARLGREGILRVYLTLAPFGGPLEGVSAASYAWFGKSPRHLSPAQAALLVALPQSPERLRPDRYPDAAKRARDRVLEIAVARGALSRDAAEAAKAELVPRTQLALPMSAPHLSERLAAGAPSGRTIVTTLDPALQRALERFARAQRARIEPGADLAAIVVSNRDRRVLAHLGSLDWREMQVDLTQAVRSPGSALKPFIYALGFDDLAVHPATLIADAPHRFGGWAPRNFDRDFDGLVTAREALQRSLNVPAVQVLERVGPARLASLLALSGVRLALPPLAEPALPLALGGVGVRLADMAMLMAALADGGTVRPLSIELGIPAAPGRAFVGPAAARATIDILEGAPAPDGIATGSGVARARRVGFKTGTSYGFRDAWSVGASADYTVAVWAGRPDGAPRPGEMGRTAAAPAMFAIFDLLPPDRAARRAPAEPGHALFRRAPPPALARFELPGETPERASRPRILFPPDGATVEALPEGVALTGTGGRAPLRWIVEGEEQRAGTRFWRPDGEGFARVVLVDADGKRAAATIRVAIPGR
jgi:penicillin-binding protein 1C